MSAPLRTATALLLLISTVGVVGYMTLSGMSLLDVAYMTAIEYAGHCSGSVMTPMKLPS